MESKKYTTFVESYFSDEQKEDEIIYCRKKNNPIFQHYFSIPNKVITSKIKYFDV